MGEAGKSSVPTVLITGFGPFRHHTQNASWITVQELLQLGIKDINFIAKEIPVEYDTTTDIIPKLWEEHKPMLTVHCGLSEADRALRIEQIACNKHYVKPDVQGKLPAGNICCKSGCDTLCTDFNIEDILDEYKKQSSVEIITSKNAGKYLCEFIYYTSLKISKKTIFIHIPPINEPYSAKELAESLAIIIKCLLKQCDNECR